MTQYPVFAFGVTNLDREDPTTLLSIKPLLERELRELFERPDVKEKLTNRRLCFEPSGVVEVAAGTESVELLPPDAKPVTARDLHGNGERQAQLKKHYLQNLGEIPQARVEALQGQGFRPLYAGEPMQLKVERGTARAFLVRARTPHEQRAIVTRFEHKSVKGESLGEITVMMLPTHDPFVCL